MECEDQIEQNPLNDEAFECHYSVAQSDVGISEEAYASLLRLVSDSPTQNAWAERQLGRIAYLARQPRTAQAHFHTASVLFVKQNEFRRAARAKLNLNWALADQGRLGAASVSAQAAKAIVHMSGHEELDIELQLQLVFLDRNRGIRLGAAYTTLHALEDRVLNTTNEYLEGLFYDTLAPLAYELGLIEKAFEIERKRAVLSHANGNAADKARSSLNSARQLLQTKPIDNPDDQAIEAFTASLEAAQAAGHVHFQAQSLYYLGRLIRGTEGRRLLEKCLALTESEQYAKRRVHCLNALGELEATDNPARAVDLIESAKLLAMRSESPYTTLYGWRHYLHVVWTVEPVTTAIEKSIQYLEEIERLRQRQGTDFARQGVSASWASAWYWLSGRILEAASAEDRALADRALVVAAFSSIEKFRARQLREQMARSKAITLPRTELELSRQVQSINKTLMEDATLTQHERQALLEQSVTTQLVETPNTSAKGSTTANERPWTSAVALPDIEKALAPNEALISYQLAEWNDTFGMFAGGSWLWVTTTDGTRVYRIPPRTEVEHMVSMFRGVLKRRDGTETDSGHFVYKALLEPGLSELPDEIDTLVIVPDRELYELPFAALVDEGGTEVARDYKLSIVPSASLWHFWRTHKKPAQTGQVFAVADPLLNTTIETVAQERGWSGDATQLGRLPYARREAQKVVSQFGGAFVVGSAATEHLIKNTNFEPYRVIHFAAHGVVDERHPEWSAIILGPGSKDEDGLLQPRDVEQLSDLDDKVVVLSACRSANGAPIDGEGVVGLAHAFHKQGAAAVVGGLWPLGDKPTEAFFDQFYAHLSRGRNLGQAIQHAQVWALRRGFPARDWSGIVVIGDASVIPFPHPGRAYFSLHGVVSVTLLTLMSGIWLLCTSRYRRRTA